MRLKAARSLTVYHKEDTILSNCLSMEGFHMVSAIKRVSLAFALLFTLALAVPAMALAEPLALADGTASIEADTGSTMFAASTAGADEAIEWCKKQVGSKVGSGQCVAFIQAYYKHLGVAASTGNGKDYATNKLPSGWKRVKGGKPQKGDILVYGASSSNSYGHVAIYESNKVTYHQNYNDVQKVRKVTGVAYNGFSNPYWGYIRPGWGDPIAKGYDRTIPDGDYAIVSTSTLNSGKAYYLDIDGKDSPAANSTNVGIWNTTGDPAKLASRDIWHVTYADGFYTITQKGTNVALDVKGASLSTGANVQVYKSNGSDAQKWAISKNGSGYRIESKCNGFSLDIKSGTITDGQSVQVYIDNSSAAQQWSFVPVSELCPSCSNIIPDGDYAIVTTSTQNNSPFYYLDIPGSAVPAAANTNVQIYSRTGDPRDMPSYEIWHLTYKNGYYTITQKDTNMALDVYGASLNMRSNVQVYKSNGGKAQQWSITPSGNGYRLKARCSGYALDVYGGTMANGTNVQVYLDNGGAAQRWSFIPVNRDITKASISRISNQSYTGSAITPKPTVVWNGTKLVEGTDYVLSYSNNTNPGTATVTITGIGSYVGTINTSFSIEGSASWQRLAGSTRYSTMAAIVSEGFSESEYAVLATGEGFPDALAASALAGAYNCPVVLTKPGTLSAQARDTLAALNVKNVFIMGGKRAISASVEQLIQDMGITTERLAGSTRADTAVKALEKVKARTGAIDTVIVATGYGFADALSIGPYSYAKKAPIVLTQSDGTLSESTLAAVRASGATKAIIVGGGKVVSQAVENQLATQGVADVTRLAGKNRYATSVEIANYAEAHGMSVATPCVATGVNFPDALAGAALAGSKGSVLLLVADENSATVSFLADRKASVASGYFLGGEGAISNELAAIIENSTTLNANAEFTAGSSLMLP